MKLPDRILDKLALTSEGCWYWIGNWNSGNGYGKVWWQGKAAMAHRVIYELLIGPIPDGLVLDHKCRHRACCNPHHLEPVTVKENTMRGDAVLFEGERHDNAA